jgi:hypothetical protein
VDSPQTKAPAPVEILTKAKIRAGNTVAQQTVAFRLFDGGDQALDRQGVFVSHIDVPWLEPMATPAMSMPSRTLWGSPSRMLRSM